MNIGTLVLRRTFVFTLGASQEYSKSVPPSHHGFFDPFGVRNGDSSRFYDEVFPYFSTRVV